MIFLANQVDFRPRLTAPRTWIDSINSIYMKQLFTRHQTKREIYDPGIMLDPMRYQGLESTMKGRVSAGILRTFKYSSYLSEYSR